MKPPPRRTLLIGSGSATLVCLVAASLLFLTSDEPDERVIANALGDALSVYWFVKSTRISATSRSENEGSESFRQRFESVVAPREDLYVAVPGNEKIGPFTLVDVKSGPSNDYTLHGIATSTTSLDRWSTEIALDNSVSGLGVPRSAFDGPTLMAGSEEATRVAEELNAARELTGMVANALLADVRIAPTSR